MFQYSKLGPQWISTGAFASGLLLDASTEKLGFKYYPITTSPIVSVDVRLVLVGTSPTFKSGVYADNADIPNDAAQLGGDSGNWTLAATGWTGAQTLASNTGTLALNVPVWVVITYVSGTINGSNSIAGQRWVPAANFFGNKARHYDGTNWTNTAAGSPQTVIVVTHADGIVAGIPLSATSARSTRNDIYVNAGANQVQGLRFKAGSQVKVEAVNYLLTKSGTPNDLAISVYEGDTLKYSQTILAANVITVVDQISVFTSPVLLAADTFLYILFSQTGTSDSNDYDLNVITATPGYISALVPSDWRMVYGTLTVPSALTVDTTAIEIPFVGPMISDPAVDLDMATGGGARNVYIGGGRIS